MKTWILACKAELLKMKKSSFIWIHLAVPILGALVVACYYSMSNFSPMDKFTMYVVLVGSAFPTMIAIVSAMLLEPEEETAFRWLLMAPHRSVYFGAKLLFLNLFGAVASILSLVFAVVFRIYTIPVSLFWKLLLLLLLSNILLYAIHSWLFLQFGKSISVFLGVCGTIVSMIFLTGLGDGLWKWIPCSMAARGMNLLVFLNSTVSMEEEMAYRIDFSGLYPICIVEIGMVLILLFLWLSRWEGRKVYE